MGRFSVFRFGPRPQGQPDQQDGDRRPSPQRDRECTGIAAGELGEILPDNGIGGGNGLDGERRQLVRRAMAGVSSRAGRTPAQSRIAAAAPATMDMYRLTDADAFNAALDVPTLHHAATAYLTEAIERVPKQKHPDGKAKVAVILSAPGLGKTHVIGRVQHHFGDRAVFVFVPQVEEHGSPIKHVHWHLLKRLFGAQPEQRPLIHGLLAKLCQHSFRRYFDNLPHTVKAKQKSLRERLDGLAVDPILEIVAEVKEPAPFLALAKSIATRCPALHADVIRAMVLGWSPCKDDAWKWLRGEQIDEKRLAELQLPPVPPAPTAVLQTLTGLLHRLQIPVVVCCDQSEKLLKMEGGMEMLTTALMGWVDQIPNLVLSMTFLKDDWKKLNESFGSFCDRTQQLNLDSLQPTQAVELIRKRMADDLLRLLQRGEDASVAGGSNASRGVREGIEIRRGMPCVLGGMAQVSDGAQRRGPGSDGRPRAQRHRRTFDRVIPWLDARQQSQPPFHPARSRYRKRAEEARSTRVASQEGWQKCS